MKTIRPTTVLDYYDGVQIFEGRDAIGGHYVGVLVDVVDRVDRYLVTGAVPERLHLFRSGELDLRTLLLEVPGDEWFLTLSDGSGGEELILRPQDGPLSAREEFLPLPDLFLDDDPLEDLVVQQARERDNVVIEFSAEPLDAQSHRIRVNTLAGVLTLMQTLVGYAYQSASQELRRLPLPTRGIPDGALMDVVVPAAAGSFRVVLEAANPMKADAFPDLAVGLKRVDELFATADDPEKSPESLRPHRGHLAGSYINLVSFLAKNKVGLSYSWATPMSSIAQRGNVSEPVARRLTEVLTNFSNPIYERVTLRGRLYRVNRSTGTWGIETPDGKRFGKVADPGLNLAGLEIGAFYTFLCMEEEAVGKEKPSLYLQGIRAG